MPPVAADDSPIRALLIEDNPRLGELTVRYLHSHGILAELVPDGSRGLVAAQSGVYDIVLLDLMLPGRDGIAVCQELRAGCAVPIIIVTARSEEADRVLGLDPRRQLAPHALKALVDLLRLHRRIDRSRFHLA